MSQRIEACGELQFSEGATVPRIVQITFTVQRYVTFGIERDRLNWIFLGDDGIEYPGTQDRPPMTEAEHLAWLEGQAEAFTIATTEPSSESV